MENPQARQKPIGVYILTVCVFLRFGVFGFINDFNAIYDADQKTPLLIAAILIGRNVFVAGAAVWAFLGDNWGRISLLIIVSLNVLWSVFTVVTYLSFNRSESSQLQITYELVNPIFWLVICWWYLCRKNVVEYYKNSLEKKALQ